MAGEGRTVLNVFTFELNDVSTLHINEYFPKGNFLSCRLASEKLEFALLMCILLHTFLI